MRSLTKEVDAITGKNTGGSVDADDNDTEHPFSAGESLALIEREQPQMQRQLEGNVVLYYAPWGAAYLLGFGAVFLTYPTALGWRLPGVAAAVIVGVLFGGAMVVSVVNGVRTGRGVRGPSTTVGAMYGWSWPLSFAALAAVNRGVTRLGVPDDAATLLWSGSSLLLVGVLYLAGGALWHSRFQYGLGVWMLVTGAGSVLVGVPGNFAVLSLAGGGGLLLTAAIHLAGRPWARRRSRS